MAERGRWAVTQASSVEHAAAAMVRPALSLQSLNGTSFNGEVSRLITCKPHSSPSPLLSSPWTRPHPAYRSLHHGPPLGPHGANESFNVDHRVLPLGLHLVHEVVQSDEGTCAAHPRTEGRGGRGDRRLQPDTNCTRKHSTGTQRLQKVLQREGTLGILAVG